MKIKKSKDIVEKLLTQQPHLRDDDNKLLASVWYIQIKKMGLIPEDISGWQVLDFVANKKLANAESVRRSRAKFQELRVDLRGKIYASRHSHISDVKQELKSFTT
jgi:hypothetical protein